MKGKLGESMTRKTAIKNDQVKRDSADKAESLAAAASKSEQSESVNVVFLKDAFLNWNGKSYKAGDTPQLISRDDYDKLIKTNHVKLLE